MTIRSGLRKYGKNTGWLLGEKIARMGITLVVGVYMARYLGPGRFGLLNFAISFVTLFSAIAALGIDELVVRDMVDAPQERESILGSGFVLRLTGSVLSIALIAVAALATGQDPSTTWLILIISSGFLFQSFRVIEFYFQSQVQARYVALSYLGQLALSSVLRLVGVGVGAPLLFFAAIVAFDKAATAVLLLVAYVRRGGRIAKWRARVAASKRLLRAGIPLALSGVVAIIYMRIDQVMLMEMLSSEAVGHYAAAVRLSEAWYFVPTVVSASLFPAILNARQASVPEYETRLQHLYDLAVWLGLLVAIPTTFLATPIIRLTYGAEFLPAASVLSIHIWAGVFVFLGVASSKWLVAENLQRYAFYRTLSGAVLNVALNLLLIPRLGIRGAAVGTICSQALAALVFDFFSRHTRKAGFMKLSAVAGPIRLMRMLGELR